MKKKNGRFRFYRNSIDVSFGKWNTKRGLIIVEKGFITRDYSILQLFHVGHVVQNGPNSLARMVVMSIQATNDLRLRV